MQLLLKGRGMPALCPLMNKYSFNIIEKSMREKNIAFLSSSASRNAGGLFDATRFLAEYLSKKTGLEVRMFSLNDKFTDSDKKFWGNIDLTTFDVVGPLIIGYAPLMRKEMLKYKIDLIHLHGIWQFPSYVAYSVAKKKNIPLVISPHGMLDPWIVNRGKFKKNIAKILYENNNLNLASCIHALNESEYRAIRKFGLKNPVCIIPNGVTINEKSKQRPSWSNDLYEGRKRLMYFGRLHPKKGLDNLIDAWSMLIGKKDGDASNWDLVIAGWGEKSYEEILKKKVDKLGVNQSIYFIGPQFAEEKERTFSHVNAVILPSFSEGLPIVPLEAWSYRLPTILSKNCNIDEAFMRGAAIEVDTTPESIVQGIERLMALDESARREMGENGFKLVEEQYEWNTVAKKMATVYDWLLGQCNKPEYIHV